MLTPSQTVYSLRIELLGIEPLIWRRVWVPAGTVLQRLHKIIQSCMGWNDSHLHAFKFGDTRYQVPDPEYPYERDGKDERGQRLDLLLKRGLREFMYTYDFGDNWEHRIVVEEERDPRPTLAYPVCVAGERACPPDDVGGTHGYMDLLEALRGETGNEHDEEERQSRLSWIGGFYDSEGFDANSANLRMSKLRRAYPMTQAPTAAASDHEPQAPGRSRASDAKPAPAHNASPEALTSAELDTLEDYLEAHGRMSLEALDGFFCALVSGPEVVLPSEYYAEIWDLDLPFADADQFKSTFELLIRHWNTIASSLMAWAQGGPPYLPILSEDETGVCRGNQWAIGYMLGVSMRHDAWSTFLGEERSRDAIMPVLALYHEVDEDPANRPPPIRPEDREAVIHALVDGLHYIFAYFLERRSPPRLSKRATKKRKTARKKPSRRR
jgi:yecA family protein